MSQPKREAPPAEPARSPPVHSATLSCENCGKETPHRILRLAPVAGGSHRALSGTARCRTCGWTHRFRTPAQGAVEVSVVVSEGSTSEHHHLRIPSLARVAVGSPLPGAAEATSVQKIEARSGHSVSSAWPAEIATVWAVRDLGAVVPVSVVEGARTWTDRLVLPRESRITVGDSISLEGESVRVVSLRARGRTWRLPEDSFLAGEVQRVYARRTVTPPAGRSPWTTGRGIPRTRASSTSASARPRSGPGEIRTRRPPRARRAAGGAAVHNASPR